MPILPYEQAQQLITTSYKLICNSNGIMLHRYLFNELYARKCKPRFRCDIADGIADSIYTLFCIDDLNSQYLARLLLKPF